MQNVVIKKLTCKGYFAADVYLFEAQNPIPPPPLHTVYVYTVRGEGRNGTREKVRGATVHKLGEKISSSLLALINTCRTDPF
jgi:hypothetical protein